MRAYGSLLVIVIALCLPLGCSLTPFPTQLTFTLRQSDSVRGGRGLSDLDHFALVVSGEGVANSTPSADVGGKNLECVVLTGSATFPLTLSQLTAGVQLSLPSGTYRFTVIGFDSSGVTSPASIAALYANSPLLQEYVVAQTTANTSQSTTVNLTSTFSAGSTANLLAQCAVATTALHGLITDSGQVKYLKGIGAEWTVKNVGDTFTSTTGQLALDAQGFAHVSYGYPTGPNGVRYATNQSGSFVSGVIATTEGTSTKDESGIALSSDNVLYAVTNEYQFGSYDARLANRSSTFWIVGAPIFSGLTDPMMKIDFVAGPSQTLGLFATVETSSSPLFVAHRDSNLVWSTTQLTSAAPTNCTTGISYPSGAIDAQGFAHVAYLCGSPGSTVIGYATNRSGAWVTSQLSPFADSSFGVVRLALDATGGMHAVYSQTTSSLKYQSGTVATGVWGTVSQILSGAENITGRFDIVAPSAGDIHVVVMRQHGASGRLTHLTNATGSWAATLAPENYAASATILNGLYAR